MILNRRTHKRIATLVANDTVEDVVAQAELTRELQLASTRFITPLETTSSSRTHKRIATSQSHSSRLSLRTSLPQNSQENCNWLAVLGGGSIGQLLLGIGKECCGSVSRLSGLDVGVWCGLVVVVSAFL